MGRLQTYQGRVRTKNNRCITGPNDACCCASPGRIVTCSELDVTNFGGTTFQLESSGWADGPNTVYDCDDCDDFNATFAVPFTNIDFITGNTHVWSAGDPPIITVVHDVPQARYSATGLGQFCHEVGFPDEPVGQGSFVALIVCAGGRFTVKVQFANAVNSYGYLYAVPLDEIEIGKLYTAGWVPNPGVGVGGVSGQSPATCNTSSLVMDWMLTE